MPQAGLVKGKLYIIGYERNLGQGPKPLSDLSKQELKKLSYCEFVPSSEATIYLGAYSMDASSRQVMLSINIVEAEVYFSVGEPINIKDVQKIASVLKSLNFTAKKVPIVSP